MSLDFDPDDELGTEVWDLFEPPQAEREPTEYELRCEREWDEAVAHYGILALGIEARELAEALQRCRRDRRDVMTALPDYLPALRAKEAA